MSENTAFLNMLYRHPALSLPALALCLASCGPVAVYHKQQTSFAELDRDLLQCQIGALRDAPVANEIRRSPPVFRPGHRICTADGCYTRPGYWIEGNIYTVDVNLDLRQRVEQTCMAQAGYTRLDAKRCPPGTPRPARAALGALNPATADQCAVSVVDGPYILRTPP